MNVRFKKKTNFLDLNSIKKLLLTKLKNKKKTIFRFKD